MTSSTPPVGTLGYAGDALSASPLNTARNGDEPDAQKSTPRSREQVYQGPEISTLPEAARKMVEGAIEYLVRQRIDTNLSVELLPVPEKLPYPNARELYTFEDNRITSVRVIDGSQMVLIGVSRPQEQVRFFPANSQYHYGNLLLATGFVREKFDDLEVSPSAPKDGTPGTQITIIETR